MKSLIVAICIVLCFEFMDSKNLEFLPQAFQMDMSGAGEDSTQTTKAPPMCCVPRSFEGYFVSVGTHGMRKLHDLEIFGAEIDNEQPDNGHIKLDIAQVSYDANNGRIAVLEKMHRIPIKAIYDFNQNKAYYIAGKHCITRTIKGSMAEICVPGDAWNQGVMTKGYGDNQVYFNNYLIGVQPRGEQGGNDANKFKEQVSMSMTVDDCMLIDAIAMGTYRWQNFLMVTQTANVTSGIVDPSVFTPPASCKQDEVEASSIDLTKYFLPQF